MSKLWHPFTRYPQSGEPNFPCVTAARGAYLYLKDGSKLFDAISSWWTILHGHGHRVLRSAVNRQLRQLDHVIFAGFTHPAADALANHLTELTGYERVFFSDNGSTAVEVAVKLAIQHEFNNRGQRKIIYTLEHAYHGDTFGAMSAAGKNIFSRPFDDYLFEVKKIPVPCHKNRQKIRKIIQQLAREKPLAFIYEPLVQGAGGMLFHDHEILNEILQTFRQAGATLIADEVFTGFYRTGTFLASDQLAIRPDILALAKGITGGFLPLGATLTRNEIFNSFRGMDGNKTFYHGHSYTAYPAACAAAVANLTLLATEMTQNKIKKLHRQLANLRQELLQLPGYYNVRHRGGILAFEFGPNQGGYHDSRRDQLYEFFMKRGVLLRPLGNTLYLVPPFCAGQQEFRSVLQAARELSLQPQ